MLNPGSVSDRVRWVMINPYKVVDLVFQNAGPMEEGKVGGVRRRRRKK